MTKNLKFIIIFLLILIISIIVQAVIIHGLQTKIKKIAILDVKDSTIVRISAKAIKEPKVLMTNNAIDVLFNYKSPFKDGLEFDELVKKYINNRWSDHYGALRGTRDKRRKHEGIDLYVPENTPLYPLTDYGIVTAVSDNPHYMIKAESKNREGEIDSVKVEYGKIVRIIYPDGISSVYAHLNKVKVKLGQVVNRNTMVGLTGVTGNLKRSGKDSHLHMELRDSKNRSFDPRNRFYSNKTSVTHFIKKLDLEF